MSLSSARIMPTSLLHKLAKHQNELEGFSLGFAWSSSDSLLFLLLRLLLNSVLSHKRKGSKGVAVW